MYGIVEHFSHSLQTAEWESNYLCLLLKACFVAFTFLVYIHFYMLLTMSINCFDINPFQTLSQESNHFNIQNENAIEKERSSDFILRNFSCKVDCKSSKVFDGFNSSVSIIVTSSQTLKLMTIFQYQWLLLLARNVAELMSNKINRTILC